MTRFPDQAPDDRWACGTDIEYLRRFVGYCKRWSCYLPTLCKSAALGAAFLGGIAIGGNADPLCRTGVDSCQRPAGELTALPPADRHHDHTARHCPTLTFSEANSTYIPIRARVSAPVSALLGR